MTIIVRNQASHASKSSFWFIFTMVLEIVLQQMISNNPKFCKSQEMNLNSKIQQVQQSHCSRLDQSVLFSHPGASEMKELITIFKEFLQINKQQVETRKKVERAFEHQDLEPRDRKVVIALPEQTGELSQAALQNYITELCNTVWSRAFYYFSNNQLSYQYTKIYSSQQVLENLVRLSQKFYLKPYHFQIINSHIQDEVLVYMLNKYPITLDQEINKNVNAAIKQADRSGELANDYLFNSPINFTIRENGEYNDLIMRSFNEILTKIECRIRNRSIYEKFQHKMQQLFESVSDEDWMKQKDDNKSEVQQIDSYQKLYGINSIKESGLEDTQFKRENVSAKIKERQKEKYKEKVQGYTSYKIGRKLPQSMRLFSAEEIASHNIKIQNPQTLRILMKWCEQLQRKFKTSNYYEQYVENLKLENGKSVCLVLDDIKICLDQLMADERVRIQKEIHELSKNNHYLQSELLMRDLFIKGSNSVQKQQKIAANYSIDIVNNLHSYIISYLNRLIHGLLTVANKFSQLPEVCHMELPSKVNLITFQIFDMIRCKCDSGEKQIIRLYSEVLKLCEGENAKLVRVINRMKRGTHDILINIRYRDVLCEIQLGVTSNKNKFIQYSNRFNHYLYELKRSPFGPLTELCSIWKSLDVKFGIYKPIPSKSHTLSRQSRVTCSNHYSYELYNKPFICSSCDSHFYQCYYIKPHLKCKICEYWICAKCQIEYSDCKSLLNAAYKNEEIIHKCSKIKSKSNVIPEYGICIYIESQEILVEPFRKVELKNGNKVFGIKHKHLYEIYDISSDEKIAKFHQKYVIFEVKSGFGKKHIKIDDDKVREYLIEQKLKRSFKNNKEKICLNYSSIINQQLDRLIQLAPKEQRPNIKKMELIGNNLESLNTIAENFPSIKILQVSKNNLKQFKGILKLTELEKLYLNDNGLTDFPPEIGEIQSLRELCICENRLKVFPETMKNRSLKTLMLSHNLIEQIPLFIQDMSQITELILKNNHIKEIPAFVGRLTKLEVLELQYNDITSTPEDIVRLQNLQSLNLSFNTITTLPPDLTALRSLNRILVRSNRLTELPDLAKLEKLDTIDCSNNLLTKVPNFHIPKLTHLNLSYNHIADFPEIQELNSSLRVLLLGHNKLKAIPNLQNINYLEQLYLNNNEIQSLDSMHKMHNLEVLSLEHNKISCFENARMEKLRMLILSENCLEQFNLMDLTSLEELDLSHNNIREFEGNVMPSIRKINLNNNQLHTIKLNNFPKLKYIYISHNILVTVPDVSDKNQIKTICLDNNCIKDLTGNILRSESLNHLNLAFNEIRHIPEELQRVINLQDKALELSRNPIESVDCWDFILRKGTKSTVEHLENIKPRLNARYSTLTV